MERQLRDRVSVTLGVLSQWLDSIACIPMLVVRNWSVDICIVTEEDKSYQIKTLTSPKPSFVLSVPAAIRCSLAASAVKPAARAAMNSQFLGCMNNSIHV